MHEHASSLRQGTSPLHPETTQPEPSHAHAHSGPVVSAACARTAPGLHERRGEIELTRRGKPVAYLVSAERHARIPRRGFVESLNEWLAAYADDLGDEPLDLPARQRARDVELPK